MSECGTWHTHCSYVPWTNIAPKRHPVDSFSAITCGQAMLKGSGSRGSDGLVVSRGVAVQKPIHIALERIDI